MNNTIAVYYDNMLKETFNTRREAFKYVYQELHDPNADKDLFKIMRI